MPDGIPSSEGILAYLHERRLESAEERAKYYAASPPNTSPPPIVSGYPFKVDGTPIAWIKSRGDLRMQEAYTQEFVRELLSETNSNLSAIARVPKVYMAFRNGAGGVIVMEYVDTTHCTVADAERIAAVLTGLLAIPFSSSAFQPGPIEGPTSVNRAPIRHPFFGGEEACIPYDSVKEMEIHANRVNIYARRHLLVWFRRALIHGTNLFINRSSSVVPQ